MLVQIVLFCFKMYILTLDWTRLHVIHQFIYFPLFQEMYVYYFLILFIKNIMYMHTQCVIVRMRVLS